MSASRVKTSIDPRDMQTFLIAEGQRAVAYLETERRHSRMQNDATTDVRVVADTEARLTSCQCVRR